MRNIDPSLIALLNDVRRAYDVIPERSRTSIHVLTRVIARLVPGLIAVDGVHQQVSEHSWLCIKNSPLLVIDLLPIGIYPGPVIVFPGRQKLAPSGDIEIKRINKLHANEVTKIVKTTKAAMRSLSGP